MTSVHISDNFFDFIMRLDDRSVKQIYKSIMQNKSDPRLPGLRRHPLSKMPSKNLLVTQLIWI